MKEVVNQEKVQVFLIQDVERINTYIIKALRKCIRPYLVDIQFNFEN